MKTLTTLNWIFILVVTTLFSFTTLGQGDNCSNAIDLCTITSPYASSTTGKANDFSFCSMSSSSDMIFYIDIPNGVTLTIGQTSNSYDSRHSLRYGGACPGTNQIVCTDDPDTQTETWTNSTGVTQRVYWIQAGWSSSNGAFNLAWSAPGACLTTCDDPSNLGATGITPQTADLSWTENGSSATWDIELGLTGFTPTGLPTANDVSSNPYTYTGLNPNTSYQFYVRSDCGTLQSNWVGPFTFVTPSCNVQNPSALTAQNVFSVSADLLWIENGNATQWDIELGATGFSPAGLPTANNVTSNPYTYTGLIPNTTYDYYVRSECGGASSSWIGPFTFTTSSFPTNYTSELIDGWARGVLQDPSGNYVWVGYANNSGTDFQVVKTDQGGNIIWKETIGGTGTEMAFDVVNSGDGGYVMVGHTNSASLIASGSYDIMVTKVDANGAHVWTRVVGTSSSEYSTQCAIIRNPDNTFSVAAVTNADMFFVQLSAVGVILAAKTLNTQSGWAYALTKASGTNGGWAVAGRYQGPFGTEYMVTKIKEDMTYDWSMVWGDGTGTTEQLNAIVENGPNDYTVFGYTYAQGSTPSNMYAARFTNATGTPNIQWIKSYGKAEGCAFNDAALTSDGKYVATGYCGSAGGGAYSDTYLVKIEPSDGSIIWQTEKPDDGTGNRQGDGVVEDAAGSFLVAGLGGFDMLKFAPDGTICEGIPGSLVTEDLGTAFVSYDNTEGQSTNTFGTLNIVANPVLTDFGTLLPGCNIVPLPVELIDFKGECNTSDVVLEWTTASEHNNAYFEVERSSDGINFESISQVEGIGNSQSLNTYRTADLYPLEGFAYYRLKQVDLNGEFKYYTPIAISCATANGFIVYPNPFNSMVEIVFDDLISKTVEVEIVDIVGKTVYHHVHVLNSEKLILDLNHLTSKGTYMLKLNATNFTSVKKIVRQ